ncbi:MAG: RNA polymerase sigma factor [Acidimicrobiales bacterium]
MREEELVERIRGRDEDAFALLVDTYHEPMVRLALTFVPNRSVAEEVVQDTWVAIIRGIAQFEGRSSLKTWMFRILANRARSAGVRERRQVAVPAIGTDDAGRFSADGAWSTPPAPWDEAVIDRLFASSMSKAVRIAIDDLPTAQRQVVTLRDLEGLSARDVCAVLDIGEGNQRVLLHRARQQLRRALELEIGAR